MKKEIRKIKEKYDELITAIALIATSIMGTAFTKDGTLIVLGLPIGILALAIYISNRKEDKWNIKLLMFMDTMKCT